MNWLSPIDGLRARLRLAFVGLMALLMAFQGYLVGTHYHAQTALYPAVAAGEPGAGQALRHDRNPSQTPDSCPICQGIALAATLLPATSVALSAPPGVVTWYVLPKSWQMVRPQRSHAWHSRGPPTARPEHR